MKVLVFGKNGMLGSAFLRVLQNIPHLEIISVDKNDLDITDENALDIFFAKVSPDFVINCAAYTLVDDCESNKDLAFSVNAYAVKNIAKFCQREEASLLHFSTDYVFNGEKKDGYSEDDIPSPINAYGQSKLLSENFIKEEMTNFYIVRISWLFGPNGKNFVDTMIKLSERGHLRVVGDQIGSPTYTNDVADYLVKEFLDGQKPFGIYHLTNSGVTSWFNFANEIFTQSGIYVDLEEITTDMYPTAAKRPKFSILLNKKLNYPLRDWKSALSDYLKL